MEALAPLGDRDWEDECRDESLWVAIWPSMAPLPDECWQRVMGYFEATELSGAVAGLSRGAHCLATRPELWVDLLYADFCASSSQRALLTNWFEQHEAYHPRELYAFRRREHALGLETARAGILHREEQVKEHSRKQTRIKVLNFIMMRMTHLLLCVCVLVSSIFLWLRLDHVVDWAFYIVFSPCFVFEVFLLLSAAVAATIYALRGSGGWTFYWNRLRGVVRWLMLYTSPWEGIVLLLLASSIVPLFAYALEGGAALQADRDALAAAHAGIHARARGGHDHGESHDHGKEFSFDGGAAGLSMVPGPVPIPRILLPFGAFWLTSLGFTGSALRRRTLSAGCLGPFIILWLPLMTLSVLLFLRCSIAPTISAYAVMAPSLTVTTLMLIFVGFLMVASCWLGWRGNRAWKEYATVTLLTLVTLLLPLFLLQIAVLTYMSGQIGADGVLIPWVVWLSGLVLCTIWHAAAPLLSTSTFGQLCSGDSTPGLGDSYSRYHDGGNIALDSDTDSYYGLSSSSSVGGVGNGNQTYAHHNISANPIGPHGSGWGSYFGGYTRNTSSPRERSDASADRLLGGPMQLHRSIAWRSPTPSAPLSRPPPQPGRGFVDGERPDYGLRIGMQQQPLRHHIRTDYEDPADASSDVDMPLVPLRAAAV